MSKNTSRLRFNKYKSSPQIAKLGDYSIKVGSGKTPKGGSSVYQDDGVILIRSQNVLDGQLELKEVAFISDEINKTMSNSEVNPRDVLLNITGASIGRCAIVPNDFPPANVNQHVCIIRADENKLDPKYLMQQILSPRIQNQINSLQAGGNREGLNFQQIRAFDVLIHDYQEQVQIGDFLSTIDSRITNQSSKLDSLQELKKGVMQKIFSQEIRFKREDGREYPDWEEKTLGDIFAQIDSGMTAEQVTGPTDFPVSRIETISDDRINIDKVGYVKHFDGIERYKLMKGDILFSNINSLKFIGRAVLVENEKLYHGMNLLKLRAKDGFSSKFLIYSFNTEKMSNQFKSNAKRAVNQASISQSDIKRLTVKIPIMEEQQKIADFLSTLDSKISLESQILETLQTMKKGLLQQMFV
ncbi:restriction endonuclease subunit S [Proteiniclasticum sp. SCR006]|uniref:Restriction endonuclease subunit S n=1 Tax=Proteiniclasticum aestuarii TaxID=2817862 RepID=A0A939HAJ7_9CLOT|nr:restriction endonuclease subunit S [Proteiniclasticum aestuarii]MBO1264491.1 restriction endonuclease subunit S [Proteiniclasticum aestuarii]